MDDVLCAAVVRDLKAGVRGVLQALQAVAMASIDRAAEVEIFMVWSDGM